MLAFPVTNTKAVVLPPAVLSELVVEFVATIGVPVMLKPLLICSAYKPGVPVFESAALDIAVFITTFKASPNHCFKF